jgi:murein DD-endopeptidase MepM/ murein hydrolase activator NlpD
MNPSSSLSTSLLLTLLLALPAAVSAQSIYIWTDEDGVTHFTDRKPVTDREVIEQRALAEPASLLDVRQSGPDEDPQWWFRNRSHGPLAVRVSLAEADNVVTYPELPAIFVLPALAERELVTIGPLDPRQSWRYQMQSQSMPGDPAGRHAPEQPYRPPFAPGASFTIGQAFGGTHSHNTPSSQYAVDIAMPIGTPVHAAREGIVMDTARWFHRSGTDVERYGNRANYVRILHDDGSMAVYAHLDYNGVRVREGQRVRRGQLIGKSGNTGFSTGPHLHFAIQINRDLELVSVPFEFEGSNGQALAPRQGLELAAP